MLPLIQEEIATNGWLSAEELINFIAVSESTPGPFAVNISTYVGSEMGGEFGILGSIFGSFCATMGVVLPSFIIILIVANMYEKFKNSKTIVGVMSGLKPAVVGLIGAAVISLATTVFFHSGINLSVFTSPEIYISLATFIIMTILAFKKKHPILIICLSAVIGIIAGYSLGL